MEIRVDKQTVDEGAASRQGGKILVTWKASLRDK